MMRQFTKWFMLIFFLSTQGCQISNNNEILPETKLDSVDQMQFQSLLRQGMYYQALEKPQLKLECEKLKQSHKANAQWQAAWLLVYALNNDFSCVSVKEALDLLQAIDRDPEPGISLQWLNNNRTSLLNELHKFHKKSDSLRRQLKTSQKKLKKANSKIQALKAIETSINKKLDEQQNRQ